MAPNFHALRAQTMLHGVPNGPNMGVGKQNSIYEDTFRNATRDPSYAGYDREQIHMLVGAEAHFGQNQVIADTVSVLTLTANHWLTTIIAPFRVNPDAKDIVWHETLFDPHVATETPHLGIVRLISSQRTSREIGYTRTGIGYAMEHDFMKTEEGIRYHLAYLQQMSNAILEAVKHDIISTLLSAYSYEREQIRKRKAFKQVSPDNYMREQSWMFAFLQKEKHSIEKLNSDIIEKMYRWKGEANTWIMPPQVMRYLSQVPNENISYQEAGPAGPIRLLESPKPFSVLAQQPVYIARTFYTDQMGNSESLLERSREFGEYYRMIDTPYDPDTPYRSRHRNIMLYSFPHDTFKELGLDFALQHSNLFDPKTDLPLKLTDDAMAYPSRLSKQHDQQRDIFRYCTEISSGKYVYNDAILFGELELKYYNVQSKIHHAHSTQNAIASKMGVEPFARLMVDFNSGLAFVNKLSNITPDAAKLDAIRDLSRLATFTDNPSAPAFGVQRDVTQDPATGFLQTDVPLNELLPGLVSYAGLKYIAAYGTATIQSDVDAARSLINTITTLVSYLKEIYPRSVFLDASYAGSLWKYATPETVFFDNFVLKGNHPAIFVSSAGNVPLISAADLLTATIVALNAQLPAELRLNAKAAYGPDQQLDVFLRVALLAMFRNLNLDPAVSNQIAAILSFAGAPLVASNFVPADRALQNAMNMADDLRRMPNSPFTTSREETEGLLISVRNHYVDNAGARLPNTTLLVRTPFKATPMLARFIINTANPNFTIAEPAYPEIPLTNVDSVNRALDGDDDMRINAPAWNTVSSEAMPLGSNSTMMVAVGAMIGAGLAGTQTRTGKLAADLARDMRLRKDTTIPVSNPMRRLLDYGDRFLSKNFGRSWEQIEAFSQSPLIKAIAHIYDATPIRMSTIRGFIDNNVRVPLDFVLVRANISVRQLTGIKMQAGRETIYTAVVRGQFEMADDATVQGHLGTLTSRHAVVLIKPQNVYIVQGLYLNGVNGGLGIQPVDYRAYKGGSGDFDNQDIIVLAIPASDNWDGSLLSLTGYTNVAEFEGLGLTTNAECQYSTAARYNALYGFSESRFGTNWEQSSIDEDEGARLSNVLLMPGTHIRYNPRTNEFNVVVHGQSLVQSMVYPNCGAVLSGKMTEVNRNPWSAYIQH